MYFACLVLAPLVGIIDEFKTSSFRKLGPSRTAEVAKEIAIFIQI